MLDARLSLVERSALAPGVAAATQGALARAGTIRQVERGKSLVRCADPATSLVLVGSGHVRVCRPTTYGALRVTGHRVAGDVVGEAALVDRAPTARAPWR
jgi:CRP-like cAMP-binding protein